RPPRPKPIRQLKRPPRERQVHRNPHHPRKRLNRRRPLEQILIPIPHLPPRRRRRRDRRQRQRPPPHVFAVACISVFAAESINEQRQPRSAFLRHECRIKPRRRAKLSWNPGSRHGLLSVAKASYP